MTPCREGRNEKARNHPGVKVKAQGAWTTSYPRGGLLATGPPRPFSHGQKRKQWAY
jgi:hypothetical protein